MCHFVLVFFSPFSIAITSIGEERANLSAFRTFVRFVLVWICRFPLPLGVWEGLRFVIVAFPGLFSYLFFLVVPTHMNGCLLTRDLLLIPILSIILLSLQWVLKKTKTNVLRYIGYRNFIKDLIKHVSLQILVNVRLLFCPNCLLHASLLLQTLD